jgi:hypothetical protein
MRIRKETEKYTTIVAGLLSKAEAVELGFYGKDIDWDTGDTQLWASQLRSAASKIAAGEPQSLTASEREEIEYACTYYADGYETLLPEVLA